MYTSDKIEEVTKAIIEAQKKIEAVTKNKMVKGTFSFGYADLAAVIDAIKSPLNDANIAIIQSVDAGSADTEPTVETRLIHESGQWLGSKTPIICTAKATPQAFGSGVSYAKRYALMALLGLPTEDDDGKAAAKKEVEIPEPNKAQWRAIDAICEKYQQKDGFIVDREKVAMFFLAEKGAYPADLKMTGPATEFLMGKNKDVYSPDKRDKYDKQLGLDGDADSQPEGAE